MSNIFKTKTTPTTSTQTSEPSDLMKPYLKGVMDNANRLYKADPNASSMVYDGPLQADVSSQTQQGLGGIMSVANSADASALGNAGVDFATGMIGSNGMSAEQQQALSSLKDTALGKYLDPENGNPYLKAQLDKMAEDIQNRVTSMAAGSGRYGSGTHQGVLSREIGSAVGDVLSTNYERERDRMMGASSAWNSALEGGLNRASGLALNGSQITDQLYAPYERMAGVGDYYDTRAQNLLDAQMNQFDRNAMLPWDQLGRFAGLVNGTAPYAGGTTVQTGTTTAPSALQSALGAGGTLAGLLGKLSDRRAKTGIRRIGTASNGLPLYLYRYKDDDAFQVGVMAQDVERVRPEAVSEGADGYKRVRYDLAFAE